MKDHGPEGVRLVNREARRRALESGPWGRCVSRCDNDQPDRQVVAVDLLAGA